MKRAFCVLALTLGAIAGHSSPARAQDAAIPTDGLELWVKADGPMQMANGQISQWSDLSPKANHAIHDAFGQAIPTLAMANGKPTLHFSGSYTGFHFKKITTVRTVFAVLSKDSTSCLPTLPNYGTPAKFWLGGNDNPTYFHPEHGCAIYNANLSEVSPNLVNGKTYVNGMLVDGRKAQFPFELGLVSIVSLDNVSADTIGRDRAFNDRSWQGDISELLIYSKPLDDVTRLGVQNILATKYALPGGSPAGGSGGTTSGGAASGGSGGSSAGGGSGGTASGGTPSAGGTASGATGGGTVSSGGTGPTAAGAAGTPTNPGTPASGSPNADVPGTSTDDANGCSCRAAGGGATNHTSLLALLALLGLALRRGRRD